MESYSYKCSLEKKVCLLTWVRAFPSLDSVVYAVREHIGMRYLAAVLGGQLGGQLCSSFVGQSTAK